MMTSLEEAIAESFPASAPPSFNAGFDLKKEVPQREKLAYR